MIKYKYKKNSDDLFLRTILAGISETLNGIVSFYQIEDDNTKKKIDVPIYIKSTGHERFLQYYFSDKNYQVCEEEMIVEGSFDVIPRGILTIQSSPINSQGKTSNFARGDVFEVDDEGYVRAYNAQIASIPISLTGQLEILTNSESEQMKVWQNTIKSLFFTEKFNVIFDGVIVSSEISFSDNIERNKNIEFRSGEKNDTLIIRISFDVETYLPIITEKMFKGHRIEVFKNTTDIRGEIEKTEVMFQGIIQGRLTDDETGNAIIGSVFLKNENDNSLNKECVLEDGYFLFENVQARTGYKIVDDTGYTIKNKINVLPESIIEIKESIFLD